MKKVNLIAISLILASAIIGFSMFLLFYNRTETVCFRNNCFSIEIADNPASQTLGLMFRKSLAETKGMLFVFSKEDLYPFWMKNTYIPLDIIWLDKNSTVVFIASNTTPQTTKEIIPSSFALYVLEINAGLTERLGIKIGDKMEIKN